ncbi:MAG TPA: acetate--CoA ligase family protein [Streptosporangiaceae bacterium]|nr:acetate--CoA ligase family protein [Streptosporangiaceae bacterium]
MTGEIQRSRLAQPHPGSPRPALLAMLEAGSVALVGASARPGSFGERMVAEVAKSTARPDIYLVNPRYAEIGGRRCYPSLADLPEPVDLVLLGVPDAALEDQLGLAATRGDRSAVIFGNAHEAGGAGVRERLALIAGAAGMELCGAGCMGFANVVYGLRAMGYVEPDPLPGGPVALVTHSGSVFSALLRTRRAIGFTLAVSSGQELVTAAASYLGYALEQPETRVLALVLEAISQPDRLREVLAAAADRDLPVVMLTAGTSATGKAMVAAHSGALAAADGGWEALARAYGIHRVADLAELADTLELFALRTRPGRRAVPDQASRNVADGPSVKRERTQRAIASIGPSAETGNHADVMPEKTVDARSARRRGIATVHDSGLERAHAADVADQLGIPFAAIGDRTLARLAELLDPGLVPANPLDVWGTGADTRKLFADSLTTLAQDDAVDAVALAVDLVTELDGDDSYPLAMLDLAASTAKPVTVISNLPSVIDQEAAAMLRREGIPVLEGMRTGLLALRHLLDHQGRARRRAAGPAARRAGAAGPAARRARALELLAAGAGGGASQLALLREYGIAVTRAERASEAGAVLAAAAAIGYPVVLKTDEPSIAHKSDAHGVLLGIDGPAQLADAYADLARRLGPAVLVCETAPPGVELALGVVRDDALGPLLVVGAGGVLVELLADRAVALPPVGPDQARELLAGLRISTVLAGPRGAPTADLDAIVSAITSLSDLALDLVDQIEALDINPLICGPHGAIAVDALVIRHSASGSGR